MRCFRSEVVCRHEPLVIDLSLEAEIPLSHFHVADVIVHGSGESKIRPRRIARDASPLRQWKRISAGSVRPWIVEIEVAGQCIPGVPRRRRSQTHHVVGVGKVIKHSTGSPQ